MKDSKIVYSEAIKAELVIKEKKSAKILHPGRAYPVIIIKKDGKIIAERSGFEGEDGKITIKLPIDASIPKGKVTAEVVIKKGANYLPLQFNEKNAQYTYTIDGDLVFNSKVLQTEDSIIIDYTSTYEGKQIDGGFFRGKIIRPDGQVAANLPIASMTKANRLTIPTEGLKGDYTVELSRLNDEAALLQTKVTVQSKIVSWFNNLPIEGIVLVATFIIFAYSIKLRTQFRKVAL